jgi:hypothetical protein
MTVSSGAVSITGAVTDATDGITLNIAAGAKVEWDATYTGGSDFNHPLIGLRGCGVFEVKGGLIHTVGYVAIVANNTYDEKSTIIVSGGEVSATAMWKTADESVAIYTYGNGSTITVSGGVVSASGEKSRSIYADGLTSTVAVSGGTVFTDSTEYDHSVIDMPDPSNTDLNVTVSGTGKVEAKGAGVTAIRTYGSVEVSGGEVGATTGYAIEADGASSSVTVSGTGKVEATGSNGYAIWTRGNVNIQDTATVSATTGYAICSYGDVTVSGGEVSATTGRAIYTYDKVVEISGGEVSATTGYAIEAAGASPSVKISGGKVSATTGRAIYADGESPSVTVSGTGNVKATGTGGTAIWTTTGSVEVRGGEVSAGAMIGYAIYATDASSSVTVSGTGKVEAMGTGGTAIRTFGSVEVSGGEVSANATTGAAIEAVGENSSVTISGGEISATTGYVIHAAGASSAVTISGGAAGATTGYVVYATGASSAVTVTGGLVFAYGDAIAGAGNVIYLPNNAGGFTDATDTGAVIAWDQGAGQTVYTCGTTTDISLSPGSGATAVWDRQSGQGGIAYANGANTGFVPLSVTTIPVAAVSAGVIDGAVGKPLTPQTAAITLHGDTVKAALVNADASSWFGNLPSGMTVAADAEEGSKTVTLTFGGAPAVSGAAAFAITVPAAVLTAAAALPAAANADARFVIRQTYALTVSGGRDDTGDGPYTEGTAVRITAVAAPSGKVFAGWESDGRGGFADASAAATTFTMPANAVTVTATYRDAAPVIYPVIKNFDTFTFTFTGDGNSFAKVDADHTKFLRLLCDGKEVPRSSYTITQGSTIITLHEDYLKSLPKGTYVFVAEFLDGVSGDIRLEIGAESKQDSIGSAPQTGDDGNMTGWWIMLSASMIGLIFILMRIRMRRRRIDKAC